MKSAFKKRYELIKKRDDLPQITDKLNLIQFMADYAQYSIIQSESRHCANTSILNCAIDKAFKYSAENSRRLVGTQMVQRKMYLNKSINRQHMLAKKSGRKKLQLRRNRSVTYNSW